jgi:hypothetical protein
MNSATGKENLRATVPRHAAVHLVHNALRERAGNRSVDRIASCHQNAGADFNRIGLLRNDYSSAHAFPINKAMKDFADWPKSDRTEVLAKGRTTAQFLAVTRNAMLKRHQAGQRGHHATDRVVGDRDLHSLGTRRASFHGGRTADKTRRDKQDKKRPGRASTHYRTAN